MEHSTIIADLATASVMAGLAAVVFHLLRLPLMLGYLLCGLLVGPHIQSFLAIYDGQTISELSHLGVIFLMFYIGLEFDVTKLQKILPSTLIALALQCVSMIFIGFFIAPMLGWNSINGFFLGGILAISSTMITISIVKHHGGLKKDHAQAAIGILILEDIVAVIMLVILSGVGITGKLAWNAVWQVSLLVGIFVAIVFFVGRMFSPYLLRLVDKTGNPEVLTLVTVGFVLGISQLAESFHFSTELGAFMAGSILSQSRLSESIEHAIEPLRNVFTAIFFVTIGMLIQPKLILEYWKIIILLTLVVILVKTFTCWFGMFLSGMRSKTAFKGALCKAQIGEFSFVIASLGQTLKVADSGLMAIAVGVSLGTIIIVPPLAGASDAIFDLLDQKSPRILKQVGEFYHTLLRSIKSQVERNALLLLIKRPALQVIAYFLIFHGIILIGSFVSKKIIGLDFFDDFPAASQLGVWILTGLLCIPFLFAIIRNLNACLMLLTEAVLPSYEKRVFLSSSLRNALNTGILGVVVILFSGSYLSAVSRHLPTGSPFMIFISLITLAGFFFWRKIININSKMEHLFIESFKQRTQSLEEQKHKSLINKILDKYPWEVNIQEIIIKNNTLPCGKRICDLKIREQTGSSVIAVARGSYTIYNPAPETPLFPQDKIILLGDISQNQKTDTLFQTPATEESSSSIHDHIKIKQVVLSKNSSFIGESLGSASIRKLYGVNIIGIQRGQERITNPLPDQILQEQDIIIAVADRESLNKFAAAAEGLVV